MEKLIDGESSGSRESLSSASNGHPSSRSHPRSIIRGPNLRPLTLGRPVNSVEKSTESQGPVVSSDLRDRRMAARGLNAQSLTREAQISTRVDTTASESAGESAKPNFQPPTYANPRTRNSSNRAADQRLRQLRKRRRLKSDIEEYLEDTYLAQVYGDFLSSHRTRLYEPEWPRSGSRRSPPLPFAPKSRTEARSVRKEVLGPLIGWYTLPETDTTAEGERKQRKIALALDKYEREKGARLIRHTSKGSSCLLYRNLPDAGLELNIMMLINRAHLAVQRGYLNRAECLVDEALGLVVSLDYQPLTAKCWYWKGLIADKRDSPSEAVRAFFNALPCVGKYAEGEHLPRYIQVYKNGILDMLESCGAFSEQDRASWSKKLDRAAAGIESLHTSPPQLSPWGNEGLALTPPRVSPKSPVGSSERGRELGIRIPSPSSTPVEAPSSKSGSPIKPLPSPRRPYFSREVVDQLYDSLSPRFQNLISIQDFTEGTDNDPEKNQTVAHWVLRYTKQQIEDARNHRRRLESEKRPGEQSQTPIPTDRRRSRMQELAKNDEWNAMVSKQLTERPHKILRKKTKFGQYADHTILSIVHEEEIAELRKRFGEDIPDPHEDYYSEATPSPAIKANQEQLEKRNDVLQKGNERLEVIAKRRSLWQAKTEAENRALGRLTTSFKTTDLVRWSPKKPGERWTVITSKPPRPQTMPSWPEFTGRFSGQPLLRRAATVRERQIQDALAQLSEGERSAFNQTVSLDVPAHRRTSEPSSPSPLRRSSLPGEDIVREDASDEDDDGSNTIIAEQKQRPSPYAAPATPEISKWSDSSASPSENERDSPIFPDGPPRAAPVNFKPESSENNSSTMPRRRGGRRGEHTFPSRKQGSGGRRRGGLLDRLFRREANLEDIDDPEDDSR